MSLYSFAKEDFLCKIKGINGKIIDFENENRDKDRAKSCLFEVVEINTLQKWNVILKDENLDGVIMKAVSDIVVAIQNEVKLDISVDETSGKAKIGFIFKTLVGSRLYEVLLDEVAQDEVSILKQRVDMLTSKVALSTAKNSEVLLDKLEQSEVSILKQRVDMLTSKVESLTAKNKELADAKQKDILGEEIVAQIRNFFACGGGLNISNCGQILTKTAINNAYRTAILGEEMKNGVHYVEFTTLIMNPNFNVRCGIISTSAESGLDSCISELEGCFEFFLRYATIYKYKGGNRVLTNLPPCSGITGPVVIGILWNADECKIHFSLNGVESRAFDNLEPGKYRFAVSLLNPWDSVKLLTIGKRM